MTDGAYEAWPNKLCFVHKSIDLWNIKSTLCMAPTFAKLNFCTPTQIPQ